MFSLADIFACLIVLAFWALVISAILFLIRRSARKKQSGERP